MSDRSSDRWIGEPIVKATNLALYMRHGCFYCSRVMGVIDNLGMDVEIRNIWESPEYEQQLVGATNRTMVPVLHYEDEAGDKKWLPESADIIQFLNDQANQ